MVSIVEYLEPLLGGRDLSMEQAGGLLDAVFAGDVPEAQVAAFLTAMRVKAATAAELAGLAGSLRRHAVRVEAGVGPLVDTCGTGGGTVKTCNVSTGAAIVAAAAGVYVAKHGNRGITSKCGSADVLEALGVRIDLGAEEVAACIREAGIGFMFAPMFHPAMRFVQPIRKALGFRTVFNQLGPLANPAGARRQVMGVADGALMETMAESLRLLGAEYAMVVHSDGLDEISTLGPTRVIEIKDGQTIRREIRPQDVGFARARAEDLSVDDPAGSAVAIRAVLSGRERGPKRDIVVLNAAAAIVAGGVADGLEDGLARAVEAIDCGAAMERLERWIRVSRPQGQ